MRAAGCPVIGMMQRRHCVPHAPEWNAIGVARLPGLVPGPMDSMTRFTRTPEATRRAP